MNRIKEIRERRGLSQERLADLVGTSRSQIVKLERGERRLSVDWMQRLAQHLNCSPAELIENIEVRPSGQRIEVKGFVQAGLWAETHELPPDEWTHIDSHGHYSEYKSVIGVVVRGDSMDRYLPEGTIIIVCPIIDYGEEPKSGEMVVVRRQCADGLHEWTVKEYRKENGDIWLVPHSTNLRHQPIRVPKGGADDTVVSMDDSRQIHSVEIWGIVVGYHNPNKPVIR